MTPKQKKDANDKLRQKALSTIGSVHRMVMGDGSTSTLGEVGERMMAVGVEIFEQSGAEGQAINVKDRPVHTGRLAEVERLLIYRNNDIAALKAVIADRNRALKLVKKRKQELKATIRRLEGFNPR